jgi:hypothetical protein
MCQAHEWKYRSAGIDTRRVRFVIRFRVQNDHYLQAVCASFRQK